jgi:hypothetical protein
VSKYGKYQEREVAEREAVTAMYFRCVDQPASELRHRYGMEAVVAGMRGSKLSGIESRSHSHRDEGQYMGFPPASPRNCLYQRAATAQ